jgi:hypothetical protein
MSITPSVPSFYVKRTTPIEEYIRRFKHDVQQDIELLPKIISEVSEIKFRKCLDNTTTCNRWMDRNGRACMCKNCMRNLKVRKRLYKKFKGVFDLDPDFCMDVWNKGVDWESVALILNDIVSKSDEYIVQILHKRFNDRLFMYYERLVDEKPEIGRAHV